MIRKLSSLWVLLLFAAAGVVSAQTVFVEDHFTGANNTTLQTHSPDTGGAWTLRAGSNMDIQTNTLQATNTNSAASYTNATAAPAANYEVGMAVTFGNPSPNNYINVLGRANNTGTNGYLAQMANGAVTVWPVTAGIKGAAIISATPSLSTNALHYLVLDMIGNQISVYVDGTQYGPATDNTYSAAGFVGLGLNSVNAGNTVADDFFAGTRAVTEARMRTITARRHDGRALIEWATGREVSNLGFRVWRQDGARRTIVTPALVAGSAFLTSATLTAGNRYRWVDDDASPRSRYWIESIAVNGRSEWSGPIAPVDAPFDAPTMAPLLRDLTQHMAPSLAATRMHPAITPNAPRRAVTPPDTLAKQQQLAAEAAVKISIDADGWYRVTRDELTAAGLDPTADPHRLHLYVEGREISMTVEGEAQGHLDAIRFYGTALDTPSTSTHVYWLVAEDGPARRIQTASSTTEGGPTPSSFSVSVERRDKLLYFAALLNGDRESFFGPVITNDTMNPALQTLRLAHLDHAAPAAELEIGLQGGGDAGNNVQHDVAVTLNGQPLDDIVFNGREASYTHRVLPLSRFADGDNTLAFTAKNGDGDVSVVSYVRITYARTYAFDGSPLVLTAGSGTSVVVDGAISPSTVALDITAPDAPVELAVTVSGGVAQFAIPPGLGRGVIVAADYAHAARVEANAPSSLHATPGADMIIIAHSSLLSAVEPLRQIRTAQGLSVLVASIDDVYDEYNYGAKDPFAVRAFLSATRNWKTVPRYVLLVGDATFDPRNYLGAGDLDLVPTKLVMTSQMKTASDSWLADFNDDGVADMAIGRLPAQTLAEAQIEVGKVVAYENAASGQPWMRSTLLVNDADASIDFASMSGAVKQLVPAGYATATIDVGASGATAARQSLLSGLDAGALFVNYIGHGSVGIWTESGLFGDNDASTLTNGARLPVVVAMTCLNGYFHDPSNLSLAESLLVAPNGGAVAVWASSCVTDARAQAAADQELARSLFADHATIGEASLAAQRKATDPDVQRTFLLFGDPAMRLKQ